MIPASRDGGKNPDRLHLRRSQRPPRTLAMTAEFDGNFRVLNLDAMVAQLRQVGIAFALDPQDYPIGRFARLHPDGNPVESWEPNRDAERHTAVSNTAAEPPAQKA